MNEEVMTIDESAAVPAPAAETENMQQKVKEAGVLLQLKQLDGKKKYCWQRGQLAREMGMMRVSPFYEDEMADVSWYAGYDGKDEPTIDALLVPVLNDVA